MITAAMKAHDLTAAVSFDDIVPLIDKVFLFQRLWQFSKPKDEAEAKKLDELFQNQIAYCKRQDIIRPEAKYGFFPSKQDGNGIIVEGKNGKFFRFDFPRSPTSPHFCLADLFKDVVPLALATVGGKVAEVGQQLFKEGQFSKMFYLKGMAAACAEATMQFLHELMIKQSDSSKDSSKRYSLGYKDCPNLADQKKIIELLNGKSIGIKVSETYQLLPEYSVSAFVVL